MAVHFQKTYISAREFVESWDKEIYDLTHLDYFIYLLINQLGNQLDNRFFVQEKIESALYLSFENIGTLCFNIGDSFEYFLEEQRYGNMNPDQIPDFKSGPGFSTKEDELRGADARRIRALLSDELIKEKSFRVDLMEHVILDTLLQFYYEELNLEFAEEDLELLQMADFVEEVIVDYIRNDGQSFLQRPGDSAIDYFEELLEAEEDYKAPRDSNWSEEEDDAWKPEESPAGEWCPAFEEISRVVQRFIENGQDRKAGMHATDVMLFQEYLTDYAGVSNLYEISDDNFLEFMAVWLVQRLSQESEKEPRRIYRSLGRFVNWVHQQYNVDYRPVFLKYFENVKQEVPRVLNAMKAYLNEYDLFEILLTRGREDIEQLSGFYEVKKVRSRIQKTIDLEDTRLITRLDGVKLNSSVFSRLRHGDIVQATLMKNGSRWQVLEIHYIYPALAKQFVQ